ncbi:MAG: AAA family ATPase, partial [Phyllobacterium sp.]
MGMDVGLTTIEEKDIARHLAVAQAMVTRFVAVESGEGKAGTEIAGTGRRFVPTISTGGLRKTREVELAKTIQSVRAGDQMLSIAQHGLLFKTRRGIAVALAVADVFARQSDLESLMARNASAPLQGEDAGHFKRLLSAASYVAAFSLAAYLAQSLEAEGEPANDIAEPDFVFDSAQDALKSIVSGLDRA